MFHKSPLGTRVLSSLLTPFFFFFFPPCFENISLCLQLQSCSPTVLLFLETILISSCFSAYIITAIPAFLSVDPLCMMLFLPNLWEALGTRSTRQLLLQGTLWASKTERVSLEQERLQDPCQARAGTNSGQTNIPQGRWANIPQGRWANIPGTPALWNTGEIKEQLRRSGQAGVRCSYK